MYVCGFHWTPDSVRSRKLFDQWLLTAEFCIYFRVRMSYYVNRQPELDSGKMIVEHLLVDFSILIPLDI